MADWRQIQARIRKAKASTDAAAKLAELYERTRDPMVAFELAQWQEKAGEHAEAARWYTAAAERFRRSQWRTKAEAALARLRAPARAPSESGEEAKAKTGDEKQGSPVEAIQPEIDHEVQPISVESPSLAETQAQEVETPGESTVADSAPGIPAATEGGGSSAETPSLPRPKPRRRGRRGGRSRRHGRGASSEAARGQLPPTPESAAGQAMPKQEDMRIPAAPAAESTRTERSEGPGISSVAAWRERSRTGDPALSSRMAQLESQLRRLLACPQAKLEQAESAPAGPGVLLLSDADQVTHYYVESCQTLRIAISNLVRGARGAKDSPRLKERLAENLGIAESRVASYLRDHCAVRWLQLDEGASELAHFAIAVLRPAVDD